MKTCLVGCGGIAAVHGSVLTSGIDTEFVAAADIKPEKAQTYAENFHTKPYPSLESMLDAEKPDVLHICTPHYLHVPMTIYALERNINVFMEKPPAISFDQLEELKKAAAKSEAQLGFCYQNRYNASIRAAKDLIDSGHAYIAKNGDVYFRVKSDPEYGKLSHLKLDDLESGNRELRSQMEDDLKEDPADFAVWKAAKPGEPAWESPYGMGRPGWHIECSAMSRTHLGKTIDLHCGGQDLIFPHHENEIAQSECANGCEFARYWMHNGFINVDNQKMSKSLHNFFTVRDVANLYGYEPIRYFMLTAGYRMPLNYTVDLIESCKNSLERLYTCRENLDFALSKTEFGTDETLKEKAEEAKKKFCTAMDDDLNTPDALAAVFDLVKDINTLSAASSKAALEAGAAAFDEITGVLGLMYNRKKDEVPAEVTELVEKRAAAKKAKDWAAADAIRAQLTEMGWAVKDTAQGPQLSKL